MTAWKWISENCANSKYILKIDDDTVADTFLLKNFVTNLIKERVYLRNTYFCEILIRPYVDRNRRNKYFITCEENNEKYFKDYCCGSALITSDLIPRLYDATFTARNFWV